MRRPYDPSRARGLVNDMDANCHDCHSLQRIGNMESASRAGRLELVCFDCFVESGDDNYRSCQEHDKERSC